MNTLKSSTKTNFPFEQMITRLSPEIVATFTPTQLDALKIAFHQLNCKKHAIDIRFSLPFPGKGVYLVFLAGSEQRSLTRRRASRTHISQGAFISIAVSTILVGAIAALTLFPLIQSSLKSSKTSSFYPTGIPWLNSRAACENTGRVWKGETCWDEQHNPNF